MYARGDKLLLYVTYVEAGGGERGGRCEVWAQTDSVEYGRLERCIAALSPDTCGQAPPGGYAGVELCDVLLARYESDAQWYRVVVLDKPGGDLVHVRFVDFGNVENVRLSTLIAPPDPILYTTAPLADRFFIADLSPINGLIWSPAELGYLNTNLVNVEFSAEVITNGSVGFPATVRLDNPLPMAGSGIAMAAGELGRVAVPTALDVGHCYEVHVTQMESLMSFFVQPGGTRRVGALDALHARVVSETAGGARLAAGQVKVGLHCVASHKGALHRAVVQELNPGGALAPQCRVCFVDYGDSATVDLSDLRPLSDACAAALPAQAIRCGLVGASGEQGPRHFAALLKACRGVAPQYIKVRSVLHPSRRHLVEIAIDPIPLGWTVDTAGGDLPKFLGASSVQSTPPGGPGTNAGYAPGAPKGMPALEPALAASPTSYRVVRYTAGAVIDVVVSHVDADAGFYAQPLAAAGQLDALMTDVNSPAMAGALVPVRGVPPGQPCLARCVTDGLLYRALVSPVNSPEGGGTVVVTRVDFGGAMETREVYAMGEGLAAAASMPVASIKCRLAGVEGCPASAVVGVLRAYESSVALVAKVVAAPQTPSAPLHVDLIYVPSAGSSVEIRLADVARQSAGIDSVAPPPSGLALGAPESVTVVATRTGEAVGGAGGAGRGAEMFVQLNRYDSEALTEFQARLNEFYEREKVPQLAGGAQVPGTSIVGRFCVCKFGEDDLFYRARVVRKEGLQFRVDFIDYGSQQHENLADMKVLLRPFAALPRQGVRCVLDPALHLPIDETHLRDCVLNTELIVEATGRASEGGEGGEVFVVRLPPDRSANQGLLKLLAGVGQQRAASTPQPTLSSPAARHPAPSPSLNVTAALPSPTFFHSPPAGSEEIYPPLRMSAGVWLDCRVSHIDDPENFYIQLIVSSGSKESLPALMDEIQRHVGSSPPGLGQMGRRPGLRDPVLARYANTVVWYRASVTGLVKASQQYEVLFVDYGNHGLVSCADLRDAPARITAAPVQAVPCSLHGVRRTADFAWSAENIDEFRASCDDKRFKLCWTGELDREGRHLVHLLDGQDNVNRSFLRATQHLRADYQSPVVSSAATPRYDAAADVARWRRASEGEEGMNGIGDGGVPGARFTDQSAGGRAEPRGITAAREILAPQGNPSLVEFKRMIYSVGQKLDCIVAFSYGPDRFYAQPKDSSSLEALMEKLNGPEGGEGSQRGLPPAEAVKGLACSARFSEDNQFYRALIVEGPTAGRRNEVKVHFVDYGNDEFVTLSALRRLSPSHASLPVQCAAFSLAGVRSSVGGAWSENVVAQFDDITQTAESVSATVVAVADAPEYEGGGRTYKVELSCKGRNVAEQLVSEGFAVREGGGGGGGRPQNVKTGRGDSGYGTSGEGGSAGFGTGGNRGDENRFRQGSGSLADGQFGGRRGEQFGARPDERKFGGQGRDDGKFGSNSQFGGGRAPPEEKFGTRSFDQAARTSREVSAEVSNVQYSARGDSRSESRDDKQSRSGRAARPEAALYQPPMNMRESMTFSRPVGLPRPLSRDNEGPMGAFKAAEIGVGSTEVVVASWIDGADDFHVQLERNTAVITKLIEELGAFYSKVRADDQLLSKGALSQPGWPCVALYPADGNWYRAQIVDCPMAPTHPAGSEIFVSVRYVDFGNIERVPFTKVKEVEARFLAAPPLQAIRCRARGIGLGQKVAPAAASKFDRVMEVAVKCKFVERDGETFVVELTTVTEGASINETALGVAKARGAAEKNAIVKDIPVATVVKGVPVATVVKAPGKGYARLEPMLTAGQEVVVFVTHVADNGSFFAQLDANSATLDGVMEALAGLHAGDEPGRALDRPIVGQACVAKYSLDEAWYRAVVEGIDSTGGGIKVSFVDYGNAETCPPNDVREIDNTMMAAPAQAVHCRIRGGAVATATEDPEGFAKLKETILDEQFTATIIQADQTIVTVKLVDNDGADVNELLLLAGASTYYQLGLASAATNEQLGIAGAATNEQLGLVEALTNEQLRLAGALTNQIEATEQNLPDPAIPTEPVEAYISHTVSPSEFYVQLGSASDAIAELSDSLCLAYDTPGGAGGAVVAVPTIGTLCCARFSDDTLWYRAVVTEVAAGGGVTVRFVDYGNTDKVEGGEDVRELGAEWKKRAPYAYRCTLGGAWSPDDCSRFVDLAKGGERAFTCSFLSAFAPYLVSLADDECRNVAERFKMTAEKSKMAAVAGEADEDEESPAAYPTKDTHAGDPMAEIPAGYPSEDAPCADFGSNSTIDVTTLLETDETTEAGVTGEATEFDVEMMIETGGGEPEKPKCAFGGEFAFVVHVESPDDFFMQPSACLDALSDLGAALKGACKTYEVLADPCVGALCAVKYSNDGLWYRARITGVDDEKTTLRFVDYGNLDEVVADAVTAGALRALPDEISTLELFAVRCRLVGGPLGGREWPEGAGAMLTELTADKELEVVVVAGGGLVGGEVATNVELYDGGASVFDALVEACVGAGGGAENGGAVIETPVVTEPEVGQGSTYSEAAVTSGIHQVMVSGVESLERVHVQWTTDSAELEATLDRLDELYSTDDTPFRITAPLHAGEACAVRQSNVWYRAVITSPPAESVDESQGGRPLSVRLVDYGHARRVDVDDLRLMTPELIALRPLAVECGLRGANLLTESERSSATLVDKLLSMTKDKILLAELSERAIVASLDEVSRGEGVVRRREVMLWPAGAARPGACDWASSLNQAIIQRVCSEGSPMIPTPQGCAAPQGFATSWDAVARRRPSDEERCNVFVALSNRADSPPSSLFRPDDNDGVISDENQISAESQINGENKFGDENKINDQKPIINEHQIDDENQTGVGKQTNEDQMSGERQITDEKQISDVNNQIDVADQMDELIIEDGGTESLVRDALMEEGKEEFVCVQEVELSTGEDQVIQVKGELDEREIQAELDSLSDAEGVKVDEGDFSLKERCNENEFAEEEGKKNLEQEQMSDSAPVTVESSETKFSDVIGSSTENVASEVVERLSLEHWKHGSTAFKRDGGEDSAEGVAAEVVSQAVLLAVDDLVADILASSLDIVDADAGRFADWVDAARGQVERASGEETAGTTEEGAKEESEEEGGREERGREEVDDDERIEEFLSDEEREGEGWGYELQLQDEAMPEEIPECSDDDTETCGDQQQGEYSNSLQGHSDDPPKESDDKKGPPLGDEVPQDSGVKERPDEISFMEGLPECSVDEQGFNAELICVDEEELDLVKRDEHAVMIKLESPEESKESSSELECEKKSEEELDESQHEFVKKTEKFDESAGNESYLTCFDATQCADIESETICGMKSEVEAHAKSEDGDVPDSHVVSEPHKSCADVVNKPIESCADVTDEEKKFAKCLSENAGESNEARLALLENENDAELAKMENDAEAVNGSVSLPVEANQQQDKLALTENEEKPDEIKEEESISKEEEKMFREEESMCKEKHSKLKEEESLCKDEKSMLQEKRFVCNKEQGGEGVDEGQSGVMPEGIAMVTEHATMIAVESLESKFSEGEGGQSKQVSQAGDSLAVAAGGVGGLEGGVRAQPSGDSGDE